MSNINEFATFATGSGANVLTPAEWAVLTARDQGFTAGTALSVQANTAWRQAAMGAYVLAQFASDTAAADVLDNGVPFLPQLKAGVRSQSLNYISAPGGTVNALTATLAPAPASYAALAGAPFRIKITSANTADSPTINLNSLGAIGFVTPKGTALKTGDLPAGAILDFICTGTAMMLVGPAISDYRQRLSGDITLYVSPSGNDANDGLTVGTAVRQIQQALNLATNVYDTAGKTVTISIADGTYSGIAADRMGSARVNLVGNGTTPSNVVVAGGTGSPLSAVRNSVLSIYGMRVTGALPVQVSSSSTLTIAGQVDFANGNSGNSQVYVTYGGTVVATGPYIISSGAVQHVTAGTLGSFISSGVGVTLTGTPNFSGQFVQANFGFIGMDGMTFTGSATGQRYSANNNGVIYVAGAGASYFPGSISGSTSNGGIYA